MASLKILDLQPEAVSLGTQRCYLEPTFQMNLGLAIGQWITVKLESEICICNVWPCSDLPEECIQLNKSVTIRQTQLDKVATSRQVNHIQADCVEIIDNVIILDSINVTVLLDSGQVTSGQNLSQTALQKYLQHTLVGTGVVKHCRVKWTGNFRRSGCPRISCLLIEDYRVKEDSSKSQNKPKLASSCVKHVGLVTPKTIINVVQIATEDVAENLFHSSRTRIAGLDDAVTLLKKLVQYPTDFPNSLEALQLNKSKGILLHGPTGVGKTSLVKYVAVECNAFLVQICSPDVFCGSPGESENNLRAAFERGKAIAESGQRCVLVFLDELDVLCPKRGVSGGTHESRIVAQLLLLMDEIRPCKRIVVIGATSRPNVIDPALRRPGRFDQEVIIGMPNTQQRLCILKAHTESLAISPDVDFGWLAKSTNGFSGADLACLCREAAFHALSGLCHQDISGQSSQPKLCMSDFSSALSRITPSLQRTASCITELEPVPWESIGGLQEIKKKLKQAVQWPLDHWQSFARLGVEGPRGVLLYGPPGCCKTTLARAAVSSGNVAFLSVNCAQLYSPFVGDSEKIMADLFQRARMSAPAVVFLDELDSIVGGRSSDNNRSLSERILSALLTEMDGIGTSPVERMQKSTNGIEFAPSPKVLVLAATNRVELVDAALLRPGRFDHLIYVPPPDAQARLDILHVHTRNVPLGDDVSLECLTTKTEHYTGADLEAVCREAALLALQQDGLKANKVYQRHFIGALQMCKASLNEQLRI